VVLGARRCCGAALPESRRRGKKFPSAQYVVGPGSYNPKPVERSADFNQPPFWSSAKRFDRKSERLFMGNEVSEHRAAREGHKSCQALSLLCHCL